MTRIRDASQKRSAAIRGGSWVALALFATMLSAADGPADAEHLLFLADQGLTVIRLRVDIDGKPQRELCRVCLDAICAEADHNQDGHLTIEEYDARVANHPIVQERQPRMMRSDAKPEKPDFGSDGRLSRDAVAAYLLRNIWPPLKLEFANSRMRRISETGELLDRPIADTQLFERLDTDGNRKLTARELERAGSVLAKLDFDEDEIIGLDELGMQPPTNAMPGGMANRPARQSDSRLSLLSPERVNAPFVRGILSRYDGQAKGAAKDLRLDRREIGLAEEIFTQADADRDGFWDFDELWRFLERPIPAAIITLRLTTGKDARAEFAPIDSAAVKLLDARPGLIHFEIHGIRFQLLLPPSMPLNYGSDGNLTGEFQSLDDDRNEYLEADDLMFGAADEDSPVFKQMDANGDGKVYLDEYLAYSHRRQQARASQLILNADNLERTLFGPLDANGDGRLSLRELTELKSRLLDWDADGDGKLVESEIPQQYRLSLFHGSGRLADQSGPTFGEYATGNTPAPTVNAPLWFRKMDRNGDGDVSRREFLGTKTQFEKIDSNGDGAIDAGEAAKLK